MSPEAIARLREARRLHNSHDGVVVSDVDLRALLDAYAALEAEKEREWQAHLAEKVTFVSEIADLKAAHAEALDALALTIDTNAEFAPTFKRVGEVLAKAGRR